MRSTYVNLYMNIYKYIECILIKLFCLNINVLKCIKIYGYNGLLYELFFYKIDFKKEIKFLRFYRYRVE